ncbi:MAG: hypothetical protein GY953_27235 [bacterium]|nr:hypothetical protein [bacterium]
MLASVRDGVKWWALALPPFLFFWASVNGEIAIGLLFIGFVLLDQTLRLIVEAVRRHKIPRLADIEPLLYLTSAVLLSFAFMVFLLPGGASSIQNPFRAAFSIGSTGASGWAAARGSFTAPSWS